jgi:hypothetical protein
MALRCPQCGKEYDVTLFEFGRSIDCECGWKISLENGHNVKLNINIEALEREIFDAVDEKSKRLDREQADEIRRRANRISAYILYSDMPRIDIVILINNFRKYVLDIFPDKQELFRLLYEARFKRLWEQFRDDSEPLFGRE